MIISNYVITDVISFSAQKKTQIFYSLELYISEGQIKSQL